MKFSFALCIAFMLALKGSTQSTPNDLKKQSTTLGFSGPLMISVEPLDQHVCPGGTAIFESHNLTGYGYGVWQISTDGGSTWAGISNAYQDTLIVQPVTISMNLYKYRRYYFIGVNSGSCRVATLYFDCVVYACSETPTQITADHSGFSYKWQVDTGTGFTDVVISNHYQGIDSKNLQVLNTPSNFNSNRYKCIVDNIDYGTIVTLKVCSFWIGNKESIGVNPASLNWEDASNWSCGQVPDSNTNVVIERGVVQVNSNTTIRSLSLSPYVDFRVNANSTLNIFKSN